MTYQATERVDAFFAHHGIKGQKWGMRRFQNADGSLTEDGKKRYLKGDGRQVSEKKRTYWISEESIGQISKTWFNKRAS